MTGDPEVVRQDTHGHAWALAVAPDGNIWGSTINRTAGDAEKNDDVVFPPFPQGGGFPRSNADITWTPPQRVGIRPPDPSQRVGIRPGSKVARALTDAAAADTTSAAASS